MENIDKKLEEIEALYKQKIANLQQTQQMMNQITTECIGLEAKIQILKELQGEQK
jgi:hypothetical protein